MMPSQTGAKRETRGILKRRLREHQISEGAPSFTRGFRGPPLPGSPSIPVSGAKTQRWNPGSGSRLAREAQAVRVRLDLAPPLELAAHGSLRPLEQVSD